MPKRSAFVLGILLAVPIACGATFWLNTPAHVVLLELKQPAQPDYQSYGPYSIYVLSGTRQWNSIGLERRYEICVARSGESPPSYGHWLEYTFHPQAGDIDAHIQSSSAEWTPEGVTFIEANGKRLFIPKALFIGGR